MTEYERERTRAWLREMRGSQSQDALARDIVETLGDWNITRDRYSKYESGSLPMGPEVLGRFRAYWAAKGRPEGPDFTPPPAPQPSLEERAVIAAERQAAALERMADWLTRPATAEADDPRRAIAEMFGALMAGSASPRPSTDRAPSGAQ